MPSKSESFLWQPLFTPKSGCGLRIIIIYDLIFLVISDKRPYMYMYLLDGSFLTVTAYQLETTISYEGLIWVEAQAFDSPYI